MQYRIRFSKLSNKKLLKTVSHEFRGWVHEDPDTRDDKIRLMRELSSDDEEDAAMLKKCRTYVGAALVDYAKGSPDVTACKPYGLKPARLTSAFQQLPSVTFAITFAVLYQIVRIEPDLLDKWVKTPRHHITNPWPRGMIKRFVKLQATFTRNRDAVFKAYTESGGVFMDDEEEEGAIASESAVVADFEEDF